MQGPLAPPPRDRWLYWCRFSVHLIYRSSLHSFLPHFSYISYFLSSFPYIHVSPFILFFFLFCFNPLSLLCLLLSSFRQFLLFPFLCFHYWIFFIFIMFVVNLYSSQYFSSTSIFLFTLNYSPTHSSHLYYLPASSQWDVLCIFLLFLQSDILLIPLLYFL